MGKQVEDNREMESLQMKTGGKRGTAWIVLGTFFATTALYSLLGMLSPLATFPGSGHVDYNAKLNSISEILKEQYYFGLDESKLLDSAAAGLAASAGDPYTLYMTKSDFQSFAEEMSGKYSGIGISVTVDVDTNQIVVVAPIDNTPAHKMGFKTGDVITKVDGKPMTGADLDEAVSLMKGEAGTKVKITLMRQGWDSEQDFEVTRENIEIIHVTAKMLDDTVGYIRISSFEENTAVQFEASLEDLKEQGMEKLMIDLRDNPGGSVHEVVAIADMLLPEGLVMYAEDKNGGREEYFSDERELGMPMALLINGGSASASEILSGALKDHQKAKLFGEKTYGKGIVQQVMEFPDGSALQVTIEQYFTPNGHPVHEVGIEPDTVVLQSEPVSEDDLMTDAPLWEALSYLQSF